MSDGDAVGAEEAAGAGLAAGSEALGGLGAVVPPEDLLGRPAVLTEVIGSPLGDSSLVDTPPLAPTVPLVVEHP